MKLFADRRVVETLHGFKDEAVLHEIFGRYIADESDFIIAKASELNQAGEKDRSYQLLADASLQYPGNIRFPLALAKLLIRDDELVKTHTLLSNLPEVFKMSEQVGHPFAHVSFLQSAENAPGIPELEARIDQDKNNLDLHFEIAAKQVVNDEYEGALRHLLVILRQGDACDPRPAGLPGSAVQKILSGNEPLQALMMSGYECDLIPVPNLVHRCKGSDTYGTFQ